MSSRAVEWARTHKFDTSAFARTAILRFLAEQADDDGYIADHAGDKGVAFIMHETCASKSTVIRTLKEFEAAGLIHREKRPYKDFGNKPTDLIVLNLSRLGTKTPWRTAKALRQIHRASRAAFGASFEGLEDSEQPVDNSPSPIGVTLTPNSKTPSQQLGVTLTPNPYLGVTLTQARCHSDILGETALIGTRVRTSPDFPVSQSVGISSALVENSQADGLTDRKNPKEKSSPAKLQPAATKHPAPPLAAPTSQSPEAPARITRGVNHTKLRQELHQAQLNISSINDDILSQMIIIVLSRATQPVRSPQRFAYSCIAKEFYELVSLAQSTLKPQETACLAFCEVHTREHSGTCPLCVKETTGHLVTVETEPPADSEAGKALLAKLRARRLAQNPAT